jgi:chromosome condensin MukBEF MukE localization factor
MYFERVALELVKWPTGYWYLRVRYLDVHGSVHHNINLIEMTNKMQLCRTIYYSTVP